MYRLEDKTELRNQKEKVEKLAKGVGEILSLGDLITFADYTKERNRIYDLENACLEYKALLTKNMKVV
jgi:hypothetical protein